MNSHLLPFLYITTSIFHKSLLIVHSATYFHLDVYQHLNEDQHFTLKTESTKPHDSIFLLSMTSGTLKKFLHSRGFVHLPVKLDCKTQVSNAASSIFLYQDVFTLQVPVCNSRLALCPINFCV